MPDRNAFVVAAPDMNGQTLNESSQAGYIRRGARCEAKVCGALRRLAKAGAVLCGMVVAISACAPSGSEAGTAATALSAVAADELIVGIDDARRITGVDDLTADPRGDEHQPRPPSSKPPGPCQVFDPQVAFGSDWAQFRSTVYSGIAYPPSSGVPAGVPPGDAGATALAPAKPLMIMQAVGVYPDGGAARTVFEQLIPALTACSALHAKYYDFTVEQSGPSTVTLHYPAEMTSAYRVESSALICVTAAGFPQTDRIADDILQRIVDRLT